jgi:hypothetical protein
VAAGGGQRAHRAAPLGSRIGRPAVPGATQGAPRPGNLCRRRARRGARRPVATVADTRRAGRQTALRRRVTGASMPATGPAREPAAGLSTGRRGPDVCRRRPPPDRSHAGAGGAGECAQRLFFPKLQRAPGFVSFTLVQGEDGVATAVVLWESQAQTDTFRAEAVAWQRAGRVRAPTRNPGPRRGRSALSPRRVGGTAGRASAAGGTALPASAAPGRLRGRQSRRPVGGGVAAGRGPRAARLAAGGAVPVAAATRTRKRPSGSNSCSIRARCASAGTPSAANRALN